jgi:hypothetical protein
MATFDFHAAPISRRGVLRVFLAGASGALLTACGGGAPRKATPPNREHSKAVRREKFWIPDVRDEWFESPVIIRGVKQLGGVEQCEVDQTDGKYVVTYNPQRTSRDAIRVKIIEIGKENGRTFDPVFEDR